MKARGTSQEVARSRECGNAYVVARKYRGDELPCRTLAPVRRETLSEFLPLKLTLVNSIKI
jgi:hypothetical protein